jgi:thioredoxin reductase (NADPH)
MSTTSHGFDVAIVGGGPAGLSAGIISACKGLKTVVFEGGTWGGLLSTVYPYKFVFNYPGIPKILASHLVSEWVLQAADLGVYLIRERVIKLSHNREIVTTEGQYEAKVVVIATGMRPNLLGIPGEEKFSKHNRGLYPYVTEPEFFRGKKVLVVGGGDTALDAVIDAHKVTDKIWLIHRKETLRAAGNTVDKVLKEKMAVILYNTELLEIKGNNEVSEVVLRNRQTNETQNMAIDRVVIAVGLVPNTEVFEELDLEMNGNFIKTDHEMRTNAEGIFAAGDIVSIYQLATVAAAQGALAAHNAFKFIKKPYWA